jgi:hypothetical protein
VGLSDAVGSGFEDVDDRCVSDAAMLAVNADAQPIARCGAWDEECAATPEAEPEPTGDDALDDSFGLITGVSGKHHRSGALGSALARCHALLPLRLRLTHELRSTLDWHEFAGSSVAG